jgi:hypothetical protein
VADEIVFEDVRPAVPVLDLDAALKRYRRLGFSAHAYAGDHRHVQQGETSRMSEDLEDSLQDRATS